MTASLTVLETGLLTTVQDAGRPGQASLGVGRSGACDLASYRLANRLVGNPEGAAVLEVTYGGLRLRAEDDVVVVTTGARCPGPAPQRARPLRSGDGSSSACRPAGCGRTSRCAAASPSTRSSGRVRPTP